MPSADTWFPTHVKRLFFIRVRNRDLGLVILSLDSLTVSSSRILIRPNCPTGPPKFTASGSLVASTFLRNGLAAPVIFRRQDQSKKTGADSWLEDVVIRAPLDNRAPAANFEGRDLRNWTGCKKIKVGRNAHPKNLRHIFY